MGGVTIDCILGLKLLINMDSEVESAHPCQANPMMPEGMVIHSIKFTMTVPLSW